jgi:DNA-binding NtrC family response regulator
LGTDLKKIFILEDESIIALDIKYSLMRAGQYLPIIIKHKEDILSLLLDERPELIMISSNIGEEISRKIFFIGKKFGSRFIILSTNSKYNCNEKKDRDFDFEVIFKPFSHEILIKKVGNLLKTTSPMFAEACMPEVN